MRKYILYGLVLLLGIASQLQAQDKKAAPAAPKKQPLAYEAFFKQGMRKIGDVLPVYTNDKQYYLEINKEDLGRDLLVSGIIVKGPWCGRSSAVTDRICFTLGRDNELEVLQEIWDVRIDSTISDPALVEAFKASNMPSVKFSYPIHAFGKDKDSYIIDITKDVTSSGKLFSFDLQWVNRPVASRFSIDTIQPLKEGVKFLVIHAQTDRMKGGFGMPGQDKHNTVRIEWGIQRLPKAQMATREADPRVGYNKITFADYSQDPSQIMNESIIRRWKLEVKPEDQTRYDNGELVVPADPILVYLDNTIAGGYREAAKVAIREWNEAFAGAGFKDVLQLQEGEAPIHWGYHLITCSFLETLPHTNTVSNPYTGEIIGANIIVSLMDLIKNVPVVQTALQAYEPKVFSELKEEVEHQVFRRQFSFQLGSVLGLTPNNVSRYAYTPEQLRDKEWVKNNGISSSMMDCALVNFLAQPGDGIALEDLFGHVSHYDRWALEFGYRVYPEGKEKAERNKLLMQAKDNAQLDYVLKAKADLDPFNLSSDILEAVKLGIKNIDTAWPQVEQLSADLDKEDSWVTYMNLTNSLTQLYTSYLRTLFQHIGTVRPLPAIKGYTDAPWTFMPRSEQKAVVDYLLPRIYAEVPEWMQNTRLRGLSGYNGDQTMTVGMRLTSQFLTSANLLDRLLTTEQLQNGKAYTAAELYAAINKAVFSNFSTTAPVNRVTTRAQYLFVEAFINNYVSADVLKNMSNPVSGFMIAQMRHTLKSIEKLSKTHATAAGRAHYRGLYVHMKHMMTKAEQDAQSKKNDKAAASQKPAAMQYNGMCNGTWL